ncbi:MAG: hypothetical protein GY697_00720 [Desulfobacterales bacterium]|nr:hypothetical protein [Desulfobacterales bacterium]
MNKMRSLVSFWLVAALVGLMSTAAVAGMKGDINDDSRIDLIEAVYALRVATQTTGMVFSPDLIEDKTLYSILENNWGETCVLEFSFAATTPQVTMQEWLYINDDSWIPGCVEEYVPGDSGTFPYEIVDGIIEFSIDGEIWPVNLVEVFADNYLTSNPDGLDTWNFTQDKVNTLLEPQEKFSQSLLSTNPWYPVEVYDQFPGVIDCNGVFSFDGNLTQTAQFVEDGSPVTLTGPYLVHEGNLTTYHESTHDSKYVTETLISKNDHFLTAVKSVLHADGTTGETGDERIYFKNIQYAKAYIAARGNDVADCFEDTDPTDVNDFDNLWSGTGFFSAGGETNYVSITLNLFPTSGTTMTGDLSFDNGQDIAISGSVANGILLFDVPLFPENEENPDCAGWDVQTAATLNDDLMSMNLMFSGDFCGSGGSQYGEMDATLQKQLF